MFGRQQAAAWRPAPWWQSALEAAVVAAVPALLVHPSAADLPFGRRLIGWFAAAVLVFTYALVFARLRPTNPPEGAVPPRAVGAYLGCVAGAVAAMILASLLLPTWGVLAAGIAVVAVCTVMGQWFERRVEEQVTSHSLDRSPVRQSRDVLKEARLRAKGRPMPVSVAEQETAVERWSRERRSAGATTDPGIAAPAALELPMPGAGEARRTVRGPGDRRPSSMPVAGHSQVDQPASRGTTAGRRTSPKRRPKRPKKRR